MRVLSALWVGTVYAIDPERSFVGFMSAVNEGLSLGE